jgi:hypothetical protein
MVAMATNVVARVPRRNPGKSPGRAISQPWTSVAELDLIGDAP